MQTMIQGYRGLTLLVGLNWDRIFTVAIVIAGLLAGAFLGQVLSGA
jgi:hypothetical protein